MPSSLPHLLLLLLLLLLMLLLLLFHLHMTSSSRADTPTLIVMGKDALLSLTCDV